MKYLSKGVVLSPSTEKMLRVSRCGEECILTGLRAILWLKGRFGVAETQNEQESLNLQFFVQMGLAEIAAAEIAADETDTEIYRMLSACIICPAKSKPPRRPLNRSEYRMWTWIHRAGLRLTMGELVYLEEQNIRPAACLLGETNRQHLTETIYNTETIFDGMLDNRMERAPAMPKTVGLLLSLLRKKRILLV